MTPGAVDRSPACRYCDGVDGALERALARAGGDGPTEAAPTSDAGSDSRGSLSLPPGHAAHRRLLGRRLLATVALSLPSLAAGVGALPPAVSPAAVAGAAGAVLVGLVTLASCWLAGPNRRRAPDALALLATLAAVAWGVVGPPAAVAAAAAVPVLLVAARYAELRLVGAPARALDDLVGRLPAGATRVADGGTERVAPGTLAVGDRVAVDAGGTVPADGVVVAGRTDLRSPLAGGDRTVAEGDAVYAGDVVTGGSALRVQATATGDGVALADAARLLHSTVRADSPRGDRAARWLRPLVAVTVAGALALAVAAAVGADAAPFAGVGTAAAVLAVAAPAALAVAVPLTAATTAARAARDGVHVRDPGAFGALREADVVAFGKTGTLTTGDRSVAAVEAAEDWSDDRVLAVAAAAERTADDALGEAVRAAAVERGVEVPDAAEFDRLPGLGVRASVEGRLVHVGGDRLLASFDVTPPESFASFARRESERGRTVLYVAVDGRVVGVVAAADRIRPESHDAVRALRDSGVDVAMLTADAAPATRSVAGDLSIHTYFSEVRPADKRTAVGDMRNRDRTVVYVGDPVDDAPAMAAADVAVALGTGDVAAEPADVVVPAADPAAVARVVRLARESGTAARRGVGAAVGYHAVALPVAAASLAPAGVEPAVAALLGAAALLGVGTLARRPADARLD